jgi:hypothetical protein
MFTVTEDQQSATFNSTKLTAKDSREAESLCAGCYFYCCKLEHTNAYCVPTSRNDHKNIIWVVQE